jgi:hypothetical protein
VEKEDYTLRAKITHVDSWSGYMVCGFIEYGVGQSYKICRIPGREFREGDDVVVRPIDSGWAEIVEGDDYV